jgi:tripartite-type tricarboxylate transporter receptor subunit TctC
MKRCHLVTAAALFAAASASTPALATDYPWKPERPVNVIVPWAAGGSTDQVIRVVAGELQEALGQTVVVVNQPGGSGSIGTRTVLDAARDGYTLASGAAKDLGTYAVSGLLDTRIEDWHLYLAVANQTVVSVNPDTPYESFDQLVQAMKEKPGAITVATAGVNSSGFTGMEAVAQVTGVTYRHVSYDGGNPAVIATVAGETQVTTQLGVEQADMIRAGRLRPLAVVSDRPLELEGAGTIPPITKWYPDYKPDANYFGVFVPKGVPEEVTATLDQVWSDVIADSEALKEYAAERGALFLPVSGEAAQQAVQPAIRRSAWILQDSGKAKVSPERLGIPRP